MGKSKGIMVIGKKRSHMGGWINQSKKAKEIKLGEKKHSADKKKKVEQKKKRKKGREEYQPTYYYWLFLEGRQGHHVAPSLTQSEKILEV
jgi:hypothetical protein